MIMMTMLMITLLVMKKKIRILMRTRNMLITQK